MGVEWRRATNNNSLLVRRRPRKMADIPRRVYCRLLAANERRLAKWEGKNFPSAFLLSRRQPLPRVSILINHKIHFVASLSGSKVRMGTVDLHMAIISLTCVACEFAAKMSCLVGDVGEWKKAMKSSEFWLSQYGSSQAELITWSWLSERGALSRWSSMAKYQPWTWTKLIVTSCI